VHTAQNGCGYASWHNLGGDNKSAFSPLHLGLIRLVILATPQVRVDRIENGSPAPFSLISALHAMNNAGYPMKQQRQVGSKYTIPQRRDARYETETVLFRAKKKNNAEDKIKSHNVNCNGGYVQMSVRNETSYCSVDQLSKERENL
jgi:hypothetical protein